MKYSSTNRLSPHFIHREVARSSTADRLELDNTPTDDAMDKAKALADNVLEPIRTHFGIPFSPQSWFRGEALEKVICRRSFERWCERKGMPVDEASWDAYFGRKSHPRGEAADIEIPGIANDVLFDWIRDNLEYDQLIREFPKEGDPMSGWVHVSWNNDGNNRNQHFTIG